MIQEGIAMKKFVYLGLLVVATPCVAFDTDRVEEAIEQSSLSLVKSQCNKIDRDESLTAQARKKLYRNLYALATDSTTLRTDTLSLMGNWRDVAKTASGTLFAGVGIALIVGGLGIGSGSNSVREANDNFNGGGRREKPGIIPLAIAAGVVSEVIGAYLLYKGITCSTQKAGVDTAKSIEKYLKGKLNADEPEKE